MKKRFFICLSITFIVILFVFITDYFKSGIDCPLHSLTGIYCFLCGCTRSTWALLDFNLQQAYNYNPLYILLFPYLILKYIEICYVYIKENKFQVNKDMIFLIINAFIFMFFRNFGMTFLQPK